MNHDTTGSLTAEPAVNRLDGETPSLDACPECHAQPVGGVVVHEPGCSFKPVAADVAEPAEPAQPASLEDRIAAERAGREIQPDRNAGQAGDPGTTNEELVAAANAEAPVPARQVPPVVAAAADDNDANFVLRLFGVNPAKYQLEGGVLDRSLLAHEVESYRPLFANRVVQGRHL
jgi:hypothetical protein